MRGTMSQTYSSNATVFIVPSVTSTGTALGFPRLSTLSTNAASDTALAGQFLILNQNTANPMTYVSIGTNPTGQGTNITTYLSNSYTNDTKFLVTNTTTWSGTAFAITTLLNGNSQTYSSFSQTRNPDGYYVSTYNKYSFATAPVSVGDCFNGKIFEYLVFSRALTTSERQQVEGYLAAKWRLSGYYPPNFPLTIPGCTMWLDGEDPAGTGTPPSAGTLATWVDKSGNGRNAVQYSSLSRPQFVTHSLNARGGVSFTAASSNCYQTQVVLPTPGTIFVVGFSSNDGFILSGIPTPNSGHPPYYATFARDVEFGINNTSDTAHSANVASTSNTNYILTGLYTGSNVTAIMTGGLLSNTVAFSGTPKTPVTTLIGINSYAGSLGSPIGGTINEFITYSTALTTPQRQQVEGYLARKWGFTTITSILPSSNPYFSLKPHLRMFEPTDISGCVLWLDAADQSSLTLSGSNITAMRDKTVFKNNVTQISATQPTYNTTDSSINFVANSSTFLRGTLSASYSNASVFVVASISSNPSPAYPRLSMLGASATANSAIVGQLLLVNGNNPSVVTYLNNGTNPTGIGGTNIMTYVSNATFGNKLLVNNATTLSGSAYTIFTKLNGNTQVYSSNSGTATISGGNVGTYNKYTLGNYPDASAAAGDAYNGKIFEYLIFNRALTTIEQQKLEGYLSLKWNLPQYNPAVTLPLTIPNCRLWLDATDPTTITGSSPVTAWRDKSSNAYSFSGTGAVTSNFISSERTSLYFNGSSYLTNNSMSITNPFTVFTVAYQTSNNSSYYRILNGLSNTNYDYYLFVGCLGSNVATFTGSPSTWSDTTSNTPATRSFLTGTLICTTVSAGTNITYVNGITMNTKTGNTVPTFTGLNIGGGVGTLTTSANQSWIGHIGEIIVYSDVLTTTQRQQIEGYLAQKWNINYNALPSTHPFITFPPTTVTRPNLLELPYTSPDFNVFFAKYSPDGSVLWALRWAATGGAAFQDSATDSSGNVYVTGLYISSSLLMYDTKGNLVRTLSNSGGYDGLVAKYTSSGDLLWTSRHIGPVTTYPTGVAVDSSGNVYAGGTWDGASLTIYSAGEGSSNVFGTTGGQTDGYIVKYNSSGIVQWSLKVVCSSYDNGGTSLKTDSSGNLYSVGINVFAAPTFYNANGTVGGSLAWNGTTEGMWLAKYNSSGTFQWALRFVTGDLNTSQGALSIDSSANLYVCSAYDSTLTLKNTGDGTAATMSNAGSYDSFLVKYSSSGSYIWNARVGGTGSADDIGNAIDGSGNVYIMGRYTGTIIIYTSGEASSITLGNSGGYDNYIAKYTSAGALLWATNIASTGNEYFKGISVDLAGNVYAHGGYEGNPITFYNAGGGVGGTLTRTAPADAYLAKYTTNGLFVWAALITGLGSGTENGNRSITDPQGNIYVGGNYSNAFLIINGV
jgi:hypothetical protein